MTQPDVPSELECSVCLQLLHELGMANRILAPLRTIYANLRRRFRVGMGVGVGVRVSGSMSGRYW